MNTFNRVVIVILLLVLMVACTLTFVVPLRTLNTVSLQSKALLDFAMRLRPVWRVLLGALLALVVDFVLGLLIFLEVRRSVAKTVPVDQATGGEVMMTVDSIGDRVKHEIDQLPGVKRARATVSPKRGGVVVELDVNMTGAPDIPGKAGHIVEATRRVVEKELGLKLIQPPKVNLHAASRPKEPKQKEKVPSPVPEEGPVMTSEEPGPTFGSQGDEGSFEQQ